MSFRRMALLICVAVAVPHNVAVLVNKPEGRTKSSIVISSTTIGYSSVGTRSAVTKTASSNPRFASMDTEFSPVTISAAPANQTNGFTSASDTTTFEMTVMASTGDSLVNETSDQRKRIVLDPNDYLGKTVTPVTLIVGLTGNVATLFALQGYPFNKISSRYVLSSLTVSDSLALITNALNKKIVIGLIGVDIRAYTRSSCKIFNFFARFAKMLSSWFVVLVCCERFVAICLPLRAKQICTKSNTLIGMAIVIITAAVFSGIWTLSAEKVGSKCNPSFWTPETEVRGKVLIYLGSSLIGLLPIAIMMTLTPIMCLVLHQNRLTRKRLTSTRNLEVTKISAMLISVCIAYIVLLLPLIVAHNLAFALGENLYATKYLGLMILATVGDNLSAINFSCNFVLYVAFNTAFRRRVFRAVICLWRKPDSGVPEFPESAHTLSTISS